MTIVQNSLTLIVRGVLLGSLLAMAVPEKTVSAGTCVCDELEDDSGHFQCQSSGQNCENGGNRCQVHC
jgi:hypothetical protein